MYCCMPDPALASLLAGTNQVASDQSEGRWVVGALALQALAFLMLSASPW